MGPPDQAPFAEFAAHYETQRKAKGLTHAKVCAAGGWHGTVNHGGSSVNWANGYGMPTVEQWAVLQPLLALDEKWSERVQRVQYEREVLGMKPGSRLAVAPGQENDRSRTDLAVTAAGSDAARQWQGWGTALKPALEPIVLARKPLNGTVAANVLAHGVGALNIDASRIHTGETITNHSRSAESVVSKGKYGDSAAQETHQTAGQALGRWPANCIHDGSEEVVAAFPETGISTGRDSRGRNHQAFTDDARKSFRDDVHEGFGDSGSAARFFYSAKADAEDRLGSRHPTVKPVDLMAYLVRLVTPPGGTTLDPFAGSGSTGVAAVFEGFNAVLIEREPEYHADILRRIAWAKGEGGLTMTQKRIPTAKPIDGDLFA